MITRPPDNLLHEIIYVDWLDSSLHTGWELDDDFDKEIAACQSVGWLVRVDDTKITLTGTVANFGTPDFQYAGSMSIPLVAITNLYRVANG